MGFTCHSPWDQLKDTPKLELANGTRLRDAGRAEEGEYHLRTWNDWNAMANGMRPAKLFANGELIWLVHVGWSWMPCSGTTKSAKIAPAG